MKIIAKNKKARFNYDILETFEAGIVLTGPEVKSVKSGHISIKEAFATLRGSEVYLTNAHITPYKLATNIEQEPTRPRKLLLKKSQINTLIGKVKTKGMSLVPLKVYTKKGLIKVEIGIGRGRKKHDKREVIKKRDQEREMQRRLSDRR